MLEAVEPNDLRRTVPGAAGVGGSGARVPGIKVAVPGPPARLVSRPRLVSLLDGATGPTVVSGPAGSGKTLLLAEWAWRRGDTAWVSLDPDDNDDGRFVAAVLAALASCGAVPEDSPVWYLQVPDRPGTNPAFLATLGRAVAGLPARVRIVLDDVHELTAPDPQRVLAALLSRPPVAGRLVLAGRQDPPPVARLRMTAALTELRAPRLRFSVAEAAELLAAAGVTLSPEQLRELVDWTDGWAAYLSLAADALRDADDPARVLAGLPTRDRAMTDYLVTEVLSPLPEDTKALLRTVSVCDEIPAPLAGELAGPAADLLAGLAGDGSLVRPAGTDRYRVAGPVRRHLCADLARQTPRRAAGLHARAATWFAAQDPVRALSHACRAGDPGLTTRLLRRHAVGLALSGEHATVRRAVDTLGDRLVDDDSGLALVSALADLHHGDVGAAVRRLRQAERRWPARPCGDTETLLRVVRSCVAQVTGDPATLLPAADGLAVGTDVPATRPLLDTLATMHRGTALLASGDLGTARDRLCAALAEARVHDQDFLAANCLTALGWLAATEGDFPLMTAWAARADAENTWHGWQATLHGATARLLLGYGALLRAEPADCARYVAVAERVLGTTARVVDHGLGLGVATLRGAAECARGGWAAGLHRIRVARAAIDPARLSPAQLAFAAVLEHRAAALLGLRDAGRDVLGWAQQWLPECAELLVMRARGQLALGRPEQAGATLAPVVAGEVPDLLGWTVADAWVLAAEAATQVADRDRAAQAVRRAVAAAAQADVRYPLVFAAPDVADLLAEFADRDGSAAERLLVRRVLAARRSLRGSPAPVPLTERERAVLRLLPTLHSFDEIAQDLTVSVNTVKTHVRAIYRKLGVRARRDAVLAAVAHGLLAVVEPRSGDAVG